MRLLITAFEHYENWEQNSSWEVLSNYLQLHGVRKGIVTRRYPVDLGRLHQLLDRDLSLGFDAIIHLGQRPGSSQISLEAIAVNIAGTTTAVGTDFESLIAGAPVAYRSTCPLGKWNECLNEQSVPSHVSYHAGTYLCNALFYISHHWFDVRRKTIPPIAFVHLPITSEQAVVSGSSMASLTIDQMTRGLSTIIEQLQPQQIV